MKQDVKQVLADVLDCTKAEVDMLLDTNIDIGSMVQVITENGNRPTVWAIYDAALSDFIYDKASEYYDDIHIYYNGSQDTHIYSKANVSKEVIGQLEDLFNQDVEIEEG